MSPGSNVSTSIVILINYDQDVPIGGVETIILDSAKDYPAAVIRIYQVLESNNLNKAKPELIVIARAGSFSSWLEWAKSLVGVHFIDYKLQKPSITLTQLFETNTLASVEAVSKESEVEVMSPNDISLKLQPNKEIKPEEKAISRESLKRQIYHNPFVSLLSSYNTTGANHAQAYEEYQLNLSNPLDIETKAQKYLLELFSKETLRAGKTKSVILTGNAGDGKTRLCRLVWQQLRNDDSFSTAGKSLEDSVIDLTKECGVRVKIIKDLSDWNVSLGTEILKQMVQGQDADGIRTVFLIAANEGRLRSALQAAPELLGLRKEVEDALAGTPNANGTIVLNLNQVSTSAFILQLINKMTTDEQWEKCERCPAINYCPIKWNRDQLKPTKSGKSALPAQRLQKLYQIIEQLGKHITFRDALIHLTYTLIGRFNCYSVQTMPEDQRPHFTRWVYYKNCYGDEADLSFQRNGVIGHLRSFDVAAVSNFHIDELILKDPPNSHKEIKDTRSLIFREDLDLGGELKIFNKSRLVYLNKELNHNPLKSSTNKSDQLYDLMKWWLPHCRRKYFFEWPEEVSKAVDIIYSPYQLIPFKSYSNMQKLLFKENNYVFLETITKALVKGLNQVFTGLFLNDDTILYLSSGTGFSTQVPVPIIRNSFITSNLKLEKEFIPSYFANQIDREPYQLLLSVPIDGKTVPLQINLLLLEYLWHIQEGGTFNYLKDECGLAVAKFQEKLLVSPASTLQNQVLRVFNFVNGKFILQTLDLRDGKKLAISQG